MKTHSMIVYVVSEEGVRNGRGGKSGPTDEEDMSMTNCRELNETYKDMELCRSDG